MSGSASVVAVPRLFRIRVRVGNIDTAHKFYSALLGAVGKRIHATLYYFDCGPVILALESGFALEALPDHIYFATSELEEIHRRANSLGCLSSKDVFGARGGDIVIRPWGERSFYVEDPWTNKLCFVDEKTVFTSSSVLPPALRS
jgi:catechol 2,3-dioxygenase-like lactoylglutathione lyase family enzyme